MGLSSSKSPLERRNTVLKRSQRKTVHSIKARTEKLLLDIKKFSGTEEDSKYELFVSEIRHLNQELNSKIRELQPQVKNIHQATVARLAEAEQALQGKVQENREKLRKKTEEQPSQAHDPTKVDNLTNNATNQRSIEETHESSGLENSADKRKTVELKFVQVVPDVSTEAEVHESGQQKSPELKSPADKRKSILKMGVAVMPVAMLEEMTKKTNQASVHYDTKMGVEDSILTKLGDTVDDLQQIECQIADFIGRKNGTQYNRIKDKLDNFLQEVTQMKTDDEYVVDQIQLCTNYVKSCLRFLDDKAAENNKDELQDDVFLTEKNNNSFTDDVQNKLQKLMKTTAI